jgi:hypothetical protein
VTNEQAKLWDAATAAYQNGAYQQLLRLAQQAIVEGEWSPIANAPKDRPLLLLDAFHPEDYSNGECPYLVGWWDADEFDWHTINDWRISPTHYREIPKPPAHLTAWKGER